MATLTRERFDAIVDRIEVRFQNRPLALRMRIALWIAFGYLAFLFWFVLVLLIALAFFCGAVAADTVLGLILLVIGSLLLTLGGIQAAELLWVGLKPPPGRRLLVWESPGLFDTLARLRAAFRTGRITRVLITPEFNAGVQEIPRLGVFGWPRHYLILGLPLLETVSPREFDAILAHETAHLSRRHGRFSSWVYRLRRTWERVFERLRQPASSSLGRMVQRFLVTFLDWYWPRFNALALVLSRIDEYAADGLAVQWTSPAEMASALWRIECQGRRVEHELWHNVWQLAKTDPQPPGNAVSRIIAALPATPNPADARRWMAQTACRLTDKLETHPSFADRIRAIGSAPASLRADEFPGAARPSAAAMLFANSLDGIRRDVDSLWQREVRRTWRQRHGRALSLQRAIQSLETFAADGHATPELLWQKAAAVLELDGPEVAEPFLRQMLAVRPDHSAARLILGQHLLAERPEEGIRLLQQIIETEDDPLIPSACEALAQHYRLAGLAESLKHVHGELSRFETASAGAERERSRLSPSDRFAPHGLSTDDLANLQETLTQEPNVAVAYLVRKELEHFPRQRLFILCLQPTGRSWGWSSDRSALLVSRLVPRLKLPGRVLTITPQRGLHALIRRITRIPDAQVYDAAMASSFVPDSR